MFSPGASATVTSAISASSSVMALLTFLRVGPKSDATRQSHIPSKRGIDLLTSPLHTRDRVAYRTLKSGGYIDTKSMTIENCVNFCNARNFVYAGVENGQECRK